MADFMTNLWTSIFTPGPTPTLLVATNVTFAALLAVLLALLFMTYSIHFVILSVIAAGLWVSINWFAGEVLRVRAEEEEAERAAGTDEKEKEAASSVGSAGVEEVEVVEEEVVSTSAADTSEAVGVYKVDADVTPRKGRATGETVWNTSAAARLAPEGARRRAAMAESTGSLSTDSEWEKVDREL